MHLETSSRIAMCSLELKRFSLLQSPHCYRPSSYGRLNSLIDGRRKEDKKRFEFPFLVFSLKPMIGANSWLSLQHLELICFFKHEDDSHDKRKTKSMLSLYRERKVLCFVWAYQTWCNAENDELYLVFHKSFKFSYVEIQFPPGFTMWISVKIEISNDISSFVCIRVGDLKLRNARIFLFFCCQ